MKMQKWRGTDISQIFKQAVIKLREESKNKVSKEKAQPMQISFDFEETW